VEQLKQRKAIEKPEITNLPPPLSPVEEARVMEDLSSGDEVRVRGARETLILHNQRFVMRTARRFFRPGAAYPFGNIDDLFSIGLIGLAEATYDFDPSKGVKFLTYAGRCIENEIFQEINKINKPGSRLESRVFVDSLDRPIPSENRDIEFIGDQISDPMNIEEDFIKRNMGELLRGYVDRLNGRERKILELRFGLDDGITHTLEEIGKVLGLTRERIRQIEKQALLKLKDTYLYYNPMETQK
jgi:RNA polymerase sporulation-specific sigma factor